MILYEYRCRDCGHVTHTNVPLDRVADPCRCGGVLKRVFGFAPMRLSSFKEHYSKALGRPVSTMRELRSGLRQASEDAEASTGIPHRFVPIDPADRSVLVTPEGAEATAREQRAAGQTEAKFISTP